MAKQLREFTGGPLKEVLTQRRLEPKPGIYGQTTRFARFLSALMNASLSSGKLVVPENLPEDLRPPFTLPQLPLQTSNTLSPILNPESPSFHVFHIHFYHRQEGYGFAQGSIPELNFQGDVQFHASRYEQPEIKVILPTHDEPQAVIHLIASKPGRMAEETRARDQRTIQRNYLPDLTSGKLIIGVLAKKPKPPRNKGDQEAWYLTRWTTQEEYYAGLAMYREAMARSGELSVPYQLKLIEKGDWGTKEIVLIQTTMVLSAIHAFRTLFPFLRKTEQELYLCNDGALGVQALDYPLRHPDAIDQFLRNYHPCQVTK